MTTEELTLTKGDMKITGSVSAIANLLVSIDNIYEDHERELRADKAKEEKAIQTIDGIPEVQFQRYYRGFGEAIVSERGTPRSNIVPISKSVFRVNYPKPREIADAYIKQFGKKYDREIAIDFIKGYLTGRRLTNKYRRRVLMSIVDIVNDTQKHLNNYKKKHDIEFKVVNKSNGKRPWIKRDWDALAREYLTFPENTSLNHFFEIKKIKCGSQGYNRIRASLINIRNVIHGTKPPVFSTSTTSSVG